MAQIRKVVTPSNLDPCIYVSPGGESSIVLEAIGSAFTGAQLLFQASNDGGLWQNVGVTRFGGTSGGQDSNPLLADNTNAAWWTRAGWKQYRIIPQTLATGQLILQITGSVAPIPNQI